MITSALLPKFVFNARGPRGPGQPPCAVQLGVWVMDDSDYVAAATLDEALAFYAVATGAARPEATPVDSRAAVIALAPGAPHPRCLLNLGEYVRMCLGAGETLPLLIPALLDHA